MASSPSGGGPPGSEAAHFSDNLKGFVLAVASSLFIGSSFIFKKKGLRRSGSCGSGAGEFANPHPSLLLHYPSYADVGRGGFPVKLWEAMDISGSRSGGWDCSQVSIRPFPAAPLLSFQSLFGELTSGFAFPNPLLQ